MSGLTVYDKDFSTAVSAHVRSVERSIKRIEDPAKMAEVVAKGNALEKYAQQIKADNATLNQLLYAKLLCCGRLGMLLPRQKAGRPKNGEEKNCPSVGQLSRGTLGRYRKIGDHFDEIEPFYAQVCEAAEDDPDEVERMSVTMFLDEVAGSADKRPTKVKRYTGNAEWYTPSEYIEAAREAMGGIDLDPASNAKANKTVKAKRYFNSKDNGLTKTWKGRVWLNPPYSRELIPLFAQKFRDELDAGNISQAIILTNNSTDTSWWHLLAERSQRICFTLGRIAFDGGKHNNTNGQTFLYYGTRGATFCKKFDSFGLVFPPN